MLEEFLSIILFSKGKVYRKAAQALVHAVGRKNIQSYTICRGCLILNLRPVSIEEQAKELLGSGLYSKVILTDEGTHCRLELKFRDITQEELPVFFRYFERQLEGEYYYMSL